MIELSWRHFINEILKALVMAAFYVAGVLTATQLTDFKIVSQQDRIQFLEGETYLQRTQINELTKRATESSESLSEIKQIKTEISELKNEIHLLQEKHR